MISKSLAQEQISVDLDKIDITIDKNLEQIKHMYQLPSVFGYKANDSGSAPRLSNPQLDAEITTFGQRIRDRLFSGTLTMSRDVNKWMKTTIKLAKKHLRPSDRHNRTYVQLVHMLMCDAKVCDDESLNKEWLDIRYSIDELMLEDDDEEIMITTPPSGGLTYHIM